MQPLTRNKVEEAFVKLGISLNRNRHSMRKMQRGSKIVSNAKKRLKFVRMRLKTKPTKSTQMTTLKTTKNVHSVPKFSVATTIVPEILHSGETKKVSSLETISPPSIVPSTITPNPLPSTALPQLKLIAVKVEEDDPMNLEELDRGVDNLPGDTEPSESELKNPVGKMSANIVNPGNFSVDVEAEANEVDVSPGHEKTGLPLQISTLEIDNMENDQVGSATIRNTHNTLPAEAMFGRMPEEEINPEIQLLKSGMISNDIEVFDDPSTALFPESVITEESFMSKDINTFKPYKPFKDVQIFDDQSTATFNEDVITEKSFQAKDVETFKPITLNSNPDLATIKTVLLDADIVTFDPDSDVTLDPESDKDFITQGSMLTLEEGIPEASIQPPPASKADATALHVHEMESLPTQAPALLATSESTRITTKGNP